MPLLKFTAVCVSAFLLNAKSGALLSENYAKRAFAAHKVTKIIRFMLKTRLSLPFWPPFPLQISLHTACRSLLWQPVAQLGAFWQNRRKTIHLQQQKEEERRLFLFSRFKGSTILYDRKNCLIWAEKLSYMTVKICSEIIFTRCFIAKNSLFFVEIFSEQIFLSLIIPKSSRHVALTIANAPRTLCAESEAALTRFFLSPPFSQPLPPENRGAGAEKGRANAVACNFRRLASMLFMDAQLVNILSIWGKIWGG